MLHTGDFKMDQLPLDGRITDLRHFAKLGEEGVDLFMSDSTNADVPGFTTAEKEIGPTLDRLFGQATKRIIVASFSSHIHRVQQVVDQTDSATRRRDSVAQDEGSSAQMTVHGNGLETSRISPAILEIASGAVASPVMAFLVAGS